MALQLHECYLCNVGYTTKDEAYNCIQSHPDVTDKSSYDDSSSTENPITWRPIMVLTLLELVKKYNDKLQDRTARKRHIWVQIHSELKARLPSETRLTVHNAEKKWKNLVAHYRKYVAARDIKGSRIKRTKFYHEIEEILLSRPTVTDDLVTSIGIDMKPSNDNDKGLQFPPTEEENSNMLSHIPAIVMADDAIANTDNCSKPSAEDQLQRKALDKLADQLKEMREVESRRVHAIEKQNSILERQMEEQKRHNKQMEVFALKKMTLFEEYLQKNRVDDDENFTIINK